MDIKKNYSLSKLNSFKVDHKAKMFAEIKTSQDLFQALKNEKLKKEKKIILGGGSNTLFTKNFKMYIRSCNIKVFM